MRIPEKMPVVVIKFTKDNKIIGYEKVKSKTREEIAKILDENKANPEATTIYKFLSDCTIEDIETAFCMLPEKTNLESLKEDIIDALSEIEQMVSDLEYEIKEESK